MKFLLEGSGIFIYPLALCSLLAVYIIVERLISLRTSRVIPAKLTNALIAGNLDKLKGDKNSSVGRILYFNHNAEPDAEALKAFAYFEMNRLEKGMFWLDVVISAAPLLGLLGTVAGLVTVFATNESTPSPELISRGVGLALSTTILGLAIAIPAIVGNSFLNRRIEMLSARISIYVERLIDLNKSRNK